MNERLTDAAGLMFPVALRHRQVFWSTLVSLLFLGAAPLLPVPQIGLLLLVMGCAGLVYAGAERLRLARRFARSRIEQAAITSVIRADVVPTFVTDPAGKITFRNQAAVDRYSEAAETLAAATGDMFASPGALFFRLQSQAEG